MTQSYIFPGQGSQTVGMGKALYDAFPVAREVFEEVDEALSQKLSALIFEGPEEDLKLTANTQPALMAVSIAAMRVLEKEVGMEVSGATYVAGHSLGEYSALCAAGSLSLTDTARLLRIRGDAMQAAVPIGEGAMAALIGADMESAIKAIEASNGPGICEIANDNAPGQIVISGTRERVEKICTDVRNHGIKMAKLLPVSAPFHCSLMAPAADRMAQALQTVSMSAPIAPLVANVTASSVSDPDEIRALLVRQVTGRVRWVESVRYMLAEGINTFLEIGAGKVLSGLIRRIERDAVVQNIETPLDLDLLR